MTSRHVFAAAAAATMLAAPAFAKTIEVSATADYARAVSAACTILSPRDQASGLAYFLAALGSDKKPTKDATETFCGGFKTAFVRRPDEWGPEGPPDPNPNMPYDFVVSGFDGLRRAVLSA